MGSLLDSCLAQKWGYCIPLSLSNCDECQCLTQKVLNVNLVNCKDPCEKGGSIEPIEPPLDLPLFQEVLFEPFWTLLILYWYYTGIVYCILWISVIVLLVQIKYDFRIDFVRYSYMFNGLRAYCVIISYIINMQIWKWPKLLLFYVSYLRQITNTDLQSKQMS